MYDLFWTIQVFILTIMILNQLWASVSRYYTSFSPWSTCICSQYFPAAGIAVCRRQGGGGGCLLRSPTPAQLPVLARLWLLNILAPCLARQLNPLITREYISLAESSLGQEVTWHPSGAKPSPEVVLSEMLCWSLNNQTNNINYCIISHLASAVRCQWSQGQNDQTNVT